MEREGAHLAFGVYARENSTPWRATRSIAGVRTQRAPYAPAWPNDQSSAMAKSTFGRAGCWLDTSCNGRYTARPRLATAHARHRIRVARITIPSSGYRSRAEAG